MELTNYQAQLAEVLNSQQQMQLEVTRLQHKAATETEWSLHAMEEWDRTLSQVLDQGSQLAQLCIETAQITAYLIESSSVSSSVSRDATKLETLLQTHQTNHSNNIKFLAEGLSEAYRGHVATVVALAACRAS